MKVQTAEELLADNIDGLKDFVQDEDTYFFYKGVICEFAKEFAKIHVNEALKSASIMYHINRKPILKAYPLSNIK